MKRTSFLILIILLFAFPSSVLADVAPPYFPPGSNLQPGVEVTAVRMEAETVVVSVLSDTVPGSLGKARVSADFSMRNTGTADEKLAVRFPISADNGRGDFHEIADIAVRVNGSQVPSRRVEFPDMRSQKAMIPWAVFDVMFPSGGSTTIQVTYSLRGTGYAPYTAFFYVLESGAGWAGTIGSADIILRLPYPASQQNVVQNFQVGWAETTRGAVFNGNEVRWRFEDFEPGPDGPVQNMEFALVSPAAWNTVLTERKNVERDPKDGEAWGRLGRAYKQIFLMNRGYRTDPGGEDLFRLGVEAYEKCLTIMPDDAQWHAGFADLLVSRSYWAAWGKNPDVGAYRGLNEIRTALELAPKDPKVLEIAENIRLMFPEGMVMAGGGYDFPWLTRTPTTIPPTATIVPAFDPQAITGAYRSGLMTFSNKKQAQLIATLNSDHSAVLDIVYENDPPGILTGTWLDFGDGTVILSLEDPARGALRFVFKVEPDRLLAVEYPSAYSDDGIRLERVTSATIAPARVDTPQPATTTTFESGLTVIPETDLPPQTPITPPAPVPQAKNPLCLSVGLIPLAGLVRVMLRKTRRG